jgi:transcriptional regulator with XRE-family HTH domain
LPLIETPVGMAEQKAQHGLACGAKQCRTDGVCGLDVSGTHIGYDSTLYRFAVNSGTGPMQSPIKRPRSHGLPEAMREELRSTRQNRGWSQAELGRRVGLPQMHISVIESGKVVPRFDTLLELVRVLGYDLLMVPRSLVPVAQALIRDHRNPDANRHAGDGEQPLYAGEV